MLMVAIGGLEAAYLALSRVVTGGATQGLRRQAWLSLARWLLLGLELMLAADIVRTVIAPTWEELGQLAAIAFIRTFLNFFLERDLEGAARAREAT